MTTRSDAVISSFSRVCGAKLIVFAGLALGWEAAAEETHQIRPVGEVETVHEGFAFTEGPAVTGDGTLYFTDIPNSTIHRVATNGTLSVFTDKSNHANGLWYLGEGQMLACEMDGAVVRYSLETGERTVLIDQHDGARFNACNDLVPDDAGGLYFTDPLFRAPTPLPQEVQAVYYLAADGNVSRVTGDIAAPNGIGLSPDGETLYVIPSQQSDMLAYDVAGPGKLQDGRVFCTLQQPEGKTGTGGDGMTLDIEGNLYITTNLGVEIVSPDGRQLGLVRFPQQPANVTFGGPEFKTLIVTARTGVYQVAMPIAGLR
ncbi:MAG: SMP-30/gluconolactonase/LRE family protein [Planctomycetota bacterium]